MGMCISLSKKDECTINSKNSGNVKQQSAPITKVPTMSENVSSVVMSMEYSINSKSIVDELNSKNIIIDSFKKSVYDNKINTIMALIEDYPNINFFDIIFTNGDYILHYSVRVKNITLLLYLIQKGININVQNTETHDTALHIAAKQKDIQSIMLLIKYSCDMNIKNKNGDTSYIIAMKTKDKNLISLFTNVSYKKPNSFPKTKSVKKVETIREWDEFIKDELVMIDYDEDDNAEDQDILHMDMSVTRDESKHNPLALKLMTSSKIIDSIKYNDTTISAPILQDWLFNNNEKVFTFVKDGHIIWNNSEININYDKPINYNDINKFTKRLSFIMIKNILPFNKNNNFGFKIITMTKYVYNFICFDLIQQNKWVLGLQKHCYNIQNVTNILNNSITIN